MGKKNIWLIIFVLLSSLISCKKESIEVDDIDNGMLRVFEDFWYTVFTNYVFWDIDKTDWQEIRRSYHPKFRQLDITKVQDKKRAVSLFREMTKTLVDGHFSIRFKDLTLKDSLIFPLKDRKLSTQNFNYDYNAVAKNFLDPGYVFGFDNTGQNNFDPITAIVGTIDKKIIYFRCNRFDLYNSYSSTQANGVKHVIDAYVALIANKGEEVKAIIFDLRNNPGGRVTDFDFLLGHLTDSQVTWGFTKYNIFDEPLKYTPWLESKLKPKRSNPLNLSILSITNSGSQSLAESFVIILKSIPRTTVLGEKTFGATGPVADGNVLYGGSVNIRDFMTVEMSSASFKDWNGNIYEGKGIEPDIQISYDQSGTSMDNQIEEAIKFLKSKF